MLVIFFYNSADNTYRWKVSNITDISNVIIPHFNKHPLVTQKYADFEIIFAKIVKILVNKDHLNYNGLQDIINLKVSLNLGLSDKLKSYFPWY